MTGESEQLRGEERAKQREERHASFRQQHEEHRRRNRPVQHRDRQLRERQPHRGQRKGEPAQPDWSQPKRRRGDVGGADQNEAPPDGRDERQERKREIARQRAAGEADPSHQEQTEPERDDVREDDARQLLGGDAPPRVEPVAHGGAGKHREADVVRDRVGEERRHRDPERRQALSEVGEGEKVVADHHGVVDSGQQHRQSDVPGRDVRDVRGQSVPRHRAQLGPQHFERGDEQHQTDQGGQRRTRSFEHGGQRGAWACTHAIASSSRRSNSSRLSLKR